MLIPIKTSIALTFNPFFGFHGQYFIDSLYCFFYNH